MRFELDHFEADTWEALCESLHHQDRQRAR